MKFEVKVLYQVGQIARNAFMSGRGVPPLGKFSDDDKEAFEKYTESHDFEVLIGRVEKAIREGSE